jgi:hypothetical protein
VTLGSAHEFIPQVGFGTLGQPLINLFNPFLGYIRDQRYQSSTLF